VVSNLFGRKGTAATTSKAARLGAVRKVDGVIPKNSNSRHHRARVPSGKGEGDMPLAATVKSRMLRFLRRSTSTRGPQGGSSARSSRKKGGGDTSTVIPNTRFSILVDSPSATRRMVTLVEPYTMALGRAGVAVTASSSGSKHAVTTKRHTSNKEGYLSASRARRHKAQVLIMVSVGTGPKLSSVCECIGQGFPSVLQPTRPIVLIGKVSDMSLV
jgi:hypothetical protein